MEFRSETVELDLAAMQSDQAAVHAYWDGLRGARRMPSWTEIEMMALPLSIIPWCSVMDVMPQEDDFRVRFWGTERTRLHGADYTDKRISDFRSPAVYRKVLRELQDVVASARPILYETALRKEDGADTETPTFRMLRLPLGEKDTVSSVLCAPHFLNNKKVIYDWLGGEAPVSVMIGPRP